MLKIEGVSFIQCVGGFVFSKKTKKKNLQGRISQRSQAPDDESNCLNNSFPLWQTGTCLVAP